MLALVGLSGGTYYYAHKIEPSLLKVHEESIFSRAIPPSFDNFKIVQFSDTHVGFQYSLQQLQDLVQQINHLQPNIVVFTGDLIDEPQSFNEGKKLSKILDNIQAQDGKYWVYGNHDHGGYGTDMVANLMVQAGFNLLQNSHTVIEKNHERIILAGIDDMILGKPDIDMALANTHPHLFTILLVHEPDFADMAKKYPVDLQLSGHSHGGQVRLPLIGHIYTPIYAEKYVSGKYEINDLILYVNNGIGTTGLPFRFFCKPEIHMFTLKANEY